MSEMDFENQQTPIEAKLVDPPSQDPPENEADSKLLQSRGAVLAMLFLVTGFLGIPLLWMNKKFSATERIVWSIVVTVYTVALIWMAAAIVMWSYRQIFGV